MEWLSSSRAYGQGGIEPVYLHWQMDSFQCVTREVQFGHKDVTSFIPKLLRSGNIFIIPQQDMLSNLLGEDYTDVFCRTNPIILRCSVERIFNNQNSLRIVD